MTAVKKFRVQTRLSRIALNKGGITANEAIKRANDTEYGLVAYLYTKDLSRGLRVSAHARSSPSSAGGSSTSTPARRPSFRATQPST